MCISGQLSFSGNVRAKAGRKGRRAVVCRGAGHDLSRIPLEGRAARRAADRRAGPPAPSRAAGSHGAPQACASCRSGEAAGPATVRPGARVGCRATVRWSAPGPRVLRGYQRDRVRIGGIGLAALAHGGHLRPGGQFGRQVHHLLTIGQKPSRCACRCPGIPRSPTSAPASSTHWARWSVSMSPSTKATNRNEASFEIGSLPASPLTESNRRPSPYHKHGPAPQALCLHR
jgi:hypothetical protein